LLKEKNMGIIAIVGRPNVGKSTLFNRLVGMRQAIVDETAGVTRDRHYGKGEWCGKEFSVVDTGGYTSNSDDIFEGEIRKQVSLAIEEADVILFLCEVGTGVTDYDAEIAQILRRCKKPVILVVNKVDTGDKMYGIHEFNSLGLGEPIAIAAADGGGTGDLLDKACALLPDDSQIVIDEHENIPRITIVGKPNVGKSSMTNALLGEERNIVTNIAGTTRDSISTYYNKFGYEFMLVDTAGLRKKNKVKEDLEFYSVMRAVRSIENSDVCILMVDAQAGIEAQDMAIYNLIQRNKKGVVIVVNKWDTIEKESNTMKHFKEDILKRIAPFTDVPIIFTSVINKQRIFDVLKAATEVYENYSRKIPTSKLNEEMLPEIENYPPPALKGKYIKIKFITQLPSPSPSFAFFCNLPQYVRDPYKRFLENRLREHFNFTGVPIQIFLRQK
jgi:ribosome-associated GTPase EngA